MQDYFDVVVIGGAVIGSAAACFLKCAAGRDRAALATRYAWLATHDLQAGSLGLSGEG